MSKLVIPFSEVVGVDRKTNPLLLGTNKLRFATNLVFEEGVLKTRPGFVHIPLNLSGQFQGACSYRPSRGISSASFSEDTEALVVAVDGRVWSYSYCNTVAITPGVPFSCKGDVTLFQAENYLIIQNPQTSTYWWDGTTLTESPGLIEQHWDETPVPEVSLEDETAPVAAIPECYPTAPYTLTFRVLDKATELPISGAGVVLKRWSTPKYRGNTGTEGTASWVGPMKKELRYFVSKTGYNSVNDIPFTVIGIDQEVVVHLQEPALECGYSITALSTVDDDFTVGSITIHNTGDAAVSILYLNTLVVGEALAGDWTVGTAGGADLVLPLAIAADETVTLVFTATADHSLSRQNLTIHTSCPASDPIPFPWGVIGEPPVDPPPPPDPPTVDPPPPPVCNVALSNIALVYDSIDSGTCTVTNTGNTLITVTDIYDNFGTYPIVNPVFPVVIPIGGSQNFTVGRQYSDIRNVGFTVETSCLDLQGTWPIT